MASFRSCALLLVFFFSCYKCSAVPPSEFLALFTNEDSKVKSPEMAANFNKLLSFIALDVYNSTIGLIDDGKNTVYGVGQCRGDISRSICVRCLVSAAIWVRYECRYSSADEVIWFNNCFLRFSDKDFFGKINTDFYLPFVYYKKPENPSLFAIQVGDLMGNITSKAVVPSNKGFGKGQIEISSNVTLHGLVQCSADLSPSSCLLCLDTLVARIPRDCSGSAECWLLGGSCIASYDINPL